MVAFLSFPSHFPVLVLHPLPLVAGRGQMSQEMDTCFSIYVHFLSSSFAHQSLILFAISLSYLSRNHTGEWECFLIEKEQANNYITRNNTTHNIIRKHQPRRDLTQKSRQNKGEIPSRYSRIIIVGTRTPEHSTKCRIEVRTRQIGLTT